MGMILEWPPVGSSFWNQVSRSLPFLTIESFKRKYWVELKKTVVLKLNFIFLSGFILPEKDKLPFSGCFVSPKIRLNNPKRN